MRYSHDWLVIWLVCKQFLVHSEALTDEEMTEEACDGWTQINRTCYKYFPQLSSFGYAKSHCENLDSFLITIHNKLENDLVLNLTQNHDVWIGLIKTGSSYYKWLDSKPVLYTNWLIYRPIDRKCVQMISGGQWTDCLCNYRFPFICKKSIREINALKQTSRRIRLISVIVIPIVLVSVMFMMICYLCCKSCHKVKLVKIKAASLKTFEAPLNENLSFIDRIFVNIELNNIKGKKVREKRKRKKSIVSRGSFFRSQPFSSANQDEKCKGDKIKMTEIQKLKVSLDNNETSKSIISSYNNIFYVHDELEGKTKPNNHYSVGSGFNICRDCNLKYPSKSNTTLNSYDIIEESEVEENYRTEIQDGYICVSIL